MTTKAAKKNTSPAWDIKPTRIRKADVSMPADSEKTTEQLQAEIDQSPTTQGPTQRNVARDKVHIAEKVFLARGPPQRPMDTREPHPHTGQGDQGQ